MEAFCPYYYPVQITRRVWRGKKGQYKKQKVQFRRKRGLRYAFKVAVGSPKTGVQSQTGIPLTLESGSLFVLVGFLNKNAHNHLFTDKIKSSSVQRQSRGGNGGTSWQREREEEEEEEQGGATGANRIHLLWDLKPGVGG